jgi:hypothetical protein
MRTALVSHGASCSAALGWRAELVSHFGDGSCLERGDCRTGLGFGFLCAAPHCGVPDDRDQLQRPARVAGQDGLLQAVHGAPTDCTKAWYSDVARGVARMRQGCAVLDGE